MRIPKRVARAAFGEYEYFRIFRQSSFRKDWQPKFRCSELTTVCELSECPYPEIRNSTTYLRTDSRCFVLSDDQTLIGVCWYWFGETYKTRNFWPLRAGEAKLVQITVAESARGQGAAEDLISQSSDIMIRSGFSALYSRVWHSHKASIRAFEKAKWNQVARVLQIYPGGRKIRLVL